MKKREKSKSPHTKNGRADGKAKRDESVTVHPIQ